MFVLAFCGLVKIRPFRYGKESYNELVLEAMTLSLKSDILEFSWYGNKKIDSLLIIWKEVNKSYKQLDFLK